MITGKHPCEFCRNGRCEMCCSTGSGVIRNAVPADKSADRMWQCPCSAISHQRLLERSPAGHITWSPMPK